MRRSPVIKGRALPPTLSACVPEQPDAKTDHHVVEGVEAHHAHQQILQNNLEGIKCCSMSWDAKEIKI